MEKRISSDVTESRRKLDKIHLNKFILLITQIAGGIIFLRGFFDFVDAGFSTISLISDPPGCYVDCSSSYFSSNGSEANMITGFLLIIFYWTGIRLYNYLFPKAKILKK